MEGCRSERAFMPTTLPGIRRPASAERPRAWSTTRPTPRASWPNPIAPSLVFPNPRAPTLKPSIAFLNPARNLYRLETLNVGVHAPMMRALQHANYTFAKKISHTADSQDQRHRMVPGSRPLLTLADTREPDYITPMLLRQKSARERTLRTRHARRLARKKRAPGSRRSARNRSLRSAQRQIHSSWSKPARCSICFTNGPCAPASTPRKKSINPRWTNWRNSAKSSPQLARYIGPPCHLRAGITTPICTEGSHFCGVKVWLDFPNTASPHLRLPEMLSYHSLPSCYCCFSRGFPVLAYDTELSDTAVREAYFLGQRNDDKDTRFFRSLHETSCRFPRRVPTFQRFACSLRSRKSFKSPARSPPATALSKRNSIINARGDTLLLVVHIEFTPTYGLIDADHSANDAAGKKGLTLRTEDFWQDFRYGIKQKGDWIEPRSIHGEGQYGGPDSFSGSGLVGAWVYVEYDARSVPSDDTEVHVFTPDDQEVTVHLRPGNNFAPLAIRRNSSKPFLVFATRRALSPLLTSMPYSYSA